MRQFGSGIIGGSSNSQAVMMMGGAVSSGLNGAISSSNINAQQLQQATAMMEVWVKSWVDYSSKYGLGYILSNGSSGVFFNDSTKIILDASGNNFEYMERKQTDRQDLVVQYSLADFPKELQKKVTLLQHFRSYLEGSEKATVSNMQAMMMQSS